jgi:hypothetical protein
MDELKEFKKELKTLTKKELLDLKNDFKNVYWYWYCPEGGKFFNKEIRTINRELELRELLK